MTPGEDVCGCEPGDGAGGAGGRGGGGPGAGEHGHEDQEVQVQTQHRQTSLHMLCDILLCSPHDNEAPSPMVGGGILERKIISAR